MTETLLALTGVSKSFAGVRALHDVDFDVQAGEVHALLGENGAGKSTLIKIISGVHRARQRHDPHRRPGAAASAPARGDAAAGIATVYQELLLFPELTVAENIFLGHAPRNAWDGTRLGRDAARARASSSPRSTSTSSTSTPRSSSLSVANRQRVEIAKALVQNASVLIMDEPTAALPEADVQRLFAIVRNGCSARGVGDRLHQPPLAEIFLLADRVTVLRDGAFVATKRVGRDHRARADRDDGRPGDRPSVPQARARRSAHPCWRCATWPRRRWCATSASSCARGEIVGLAGLIGSGRSEVAQSVFGITPAIAGEILVDGQPVRIGSAAPGQAASASPTCPRTAAPRASSGR